jgi:hypothetical protein
MKLSVQASITMPIAKTFSDAPGLAVRVKKAHRDEGELNAWRSKRRTVVDVRRGRFRRFRMYVAGHHHQQLGHAQGNQGGTERRRAVACRGRSMVASTAAVFRVHRHFYRDCRRAMPGAGRFGRGHGHRRHRGCRMASCMHPTVHIQRLGMDWQRHQHQPRKTRQNPKERRANNVVG